jgi:hypothetical protein
MMTSRGAAIAPAPVGTSTNTSTAATTTIATTTAESASDCFHVRPSWRKKVRKTEGSPPA